MPVHKKQHITSTNSSGSDASSSHSSVQPTFHQHLRGQIREATRVVMEEMIFPQFGGALEERENAHSSALARMTLTRFCRASTDWS